jgi:hypothetical protein
MIQPPLLIFRDVPFGPDMKIEVAPLGAIQTVRARGGVENLVVMDKLPGDRQQQRVALVRAHPD